MSSNSRDPWGSLPRHYTIHNGDGILHFSHKTLRRIQPRDLCGQKTLLPHPPIILCYYRPLRGPGHRRLFSIITYKFGKVLKFTTRLNEWLLRYNALYAVLEMSPFLDGFYHIQYILTQTLLTIICYCRYTILSIISS